MRDPLLIPQNPLAFIVECVSAGRLLWTYHVNMRLPERGISRSMVVDSVTEYEIIETYLDDKYLPSYLVLAQYGDTAFHVLFAVDVLTRNVRVITRLPPKCQRVERRFPKEIVIMKCHVCGADLRPVKTDLPFKVGDEAIVILKGLPVLQCSGCREFLIEDHVMAEIEAILDQVSGAAELEVVRYAA